MGHILQGNLLLNGPKLKGYLGHTIHNAGLLILPKGLMGRE